MRRVGQRSSYFRSPVASLIVLATLLFASQVCAEQVPAGWYDLAGPLRDAAMGRTTVGAGTVGTTSAGLVQVEVLFRSPSDAYRINLAQYGATVEFRRDVRAQCLVPPSSLLEIAALAEVAQVTPPAAVIPCQGFGATVSEAVQRTNASAMHLAGFRGAQAKVAIIDLGFADLANAEVPAGAQVVSLRTDQSTTANRHGTAMAETVMDMAPDADLLLVAVDTPMSIESAANFVAGQGCEVAVMGLVVVEGPYDGSHSLARAVDSATATGMLWIQAAGNLAERHWAGTYRDTDGNAVHEFDSNVEGINLDVQTAGTVDAYLSWYETGGPQTGQDYDLVLTDAQGAIVAQSAVTQNGDDPPRERLQAVVAAGVYSVQIHRIAGDPLQLDNFQLFIPDYDIAPDTLRVPESSFATPAEATGAFTVGAVRGSDVDTTPYNLATVAVDVIEPFSSRGPTLSGLVKPDLVAPDGCRTSFEAVGATPISEGGDWISPAAFGTSFAAAHVAGAVAVLLSEDQTRSKSELVDALIRLAVAVPPPPETQLPLPNSTYGNGRVNLRVGTDVAKPVGVITYPRSGDTISTTEPVITAYLSDEGSGVEPTSIALTLDGELLNGWVFDPQTGILTYRVAQPNHEPLSRSSHQIALEVSDFEGNKSDQAVVSFRVSPPTVDAGLHMISLPFGQLADSRPSVIFGLPLSNITIVRWLPTDATVGNKYHWWGGPAQVQDQFASFEPLDAREPPYVVSDPPAGLGYFLRIPSPAILNVSGWSLSDRVSYDIELSVGSTLPRGWNMIGCPFPDPVTWGGAEFITDGVRQDVRDAIDDGVTDGILFGLKRAGNSFYYDFLPDPLAGSLKPFEGYWVHVLKDTTLRVYNSVITAGATAPVASAAEKPSESSWTLKFGASIAGAQDPANYIGVAPAATDGYDVAGDVPEPPALSTPVKVYIRHDDWGVQSGAYAKDVRGLVGTAQQWDVTVECASAGADVTVAWPDLNATVPAGVVLTLTDKDGGNDVFMRTVAGYTYRASSAEDVRHFTITARPADGRALVLTNVRTQQAPDGAVRLSYAVNCAAQVSAEVLNIAGRSIKQLGETAAAPGVTQTLTWNGDNNSGVKVPAGRYMLRLAARTADGQAAHSVRTFQVGR